MQHVVHSGLKRDVLLAADYTLITLNDLLFGQRAFFLVPSPASSVFLLRQTARSAAH